MNAAPDDTARGDGVARPALAHLARTLGAPGDPLEFLAEVPDPDLREFRCASPTNCAAIRAR